MSSRVPLYTFLLTVGISILAGFLTALPYYNDGRPMLQRLTSIAHFIKPPPARTMATTSTTLSGVKMPSSWHRGPDDSFHGKITSDGPFQPEKDRYHLYLGLFCPFAHRANFVREWKHLEEYAGIDISVVKPYPRGNDKGWPGWRFNHKNQDHYEGATEDKLFGSKYLHEVYFKADKDYTGRYSVPVLWDKKLNTIVNNESAELLRDLQTAFDGILPPETANLTLYPQDLQKEIDAIELWLTSSLNAGVYKAGFAPDQESYSRNVLAPFAALNKLEKIAHSHGGPYLLGRQLTETDVRAYATIIRFDTVYHQHFKCNLAEIRHKYPVLNNWLKHMYWDHSAFKNTTDFRHIKENYTKSMLDINPKAITPVGPWPNVEEGYESNWNKLQPGGVDMPEVVELEKTLG